MKPLLGRGPLTQEDFEIWIRNRDRWPRPLMSRYSRADSRAAELMLMLARGGCPVCLGEYSHAKECEHQWAVWRVMA